MILRKIRHFILKHLVLQPQIDKNREERNVLLLLLLLLFTRASPLITAVKQEGMVTKTKDVLIHSPFNLVKLKGQEIQWIINMTPLEWKYASTRLSIEKLTLITYSIYEPSALWSLPVLVTYEYFTSVSNFTMVIFIWVRV